MKWSPHDRQYYECAANYVVMAINGLSRLRSDRSMAPQWLVNYRVKSDASVEEKVSRKRRFRPDYDASRLTDIAGVRVIVESCCVAKLLADHIRTSKMFHVQEKDSEEFVDAPRSDGYRGIHLILAVPVKLENERTVYVQLQVRTVLQHQWAELSHCDFYKSVDDIPPMLLSSMRALSGI